MRMDVDNEHQEGPEEENVPKQQGAGDGASPSRAAGTRVATSSFRGVCWHRKSRRWQSAINASGRHVYLGSFDTEEEAARQFDKVAIRVRGAKAKLNFPYEDYVGKDGVLLTDPKLEQLVSEARKALVEKQRWLEANDDTRAGGGKRRRLGGVSGAASGGAAGTTGLAASRTGQVDLDPRMIGVCNPLGQGPAAASGHAYFDMYGTYGTSICGRGGGGGSPSGPHGAFGGPGVASLGADAPLVGDFGGDFAAALQPQPPPAGAAAAALRSLMLLPRDRESLLQPEHLRPGRLLQPIRTGDVGGGGALDGAAPPGRLRMTADPTAGGVRIGGAVLHGAVHTGVAPLGPGVDSNTEGHAMTELLMPRRIGLHATDAIAASGGSGGGGQESAGYPLEYGTADLSRRHPYWAPRAAAATSTAEVAAGGEPVSFCLDLRREGMAAAALPGGGAAERRGVTPEALAPPSSYIHLGGGGGGGIAAGGFVREAVATRAATVAGPMEALLQAKEVKEAKEAGCPVAAGAVGGAAGSLDLASLIGRFLSGVQRQLPPGMEINSLIPCADGTLLGYTFVRISRCSAAATTTATAAARQTGCRNSNSNGEEADGAAAAAAAGGSDRGDGGSACGRVVTAKEQEEEGRKQGTDEGGGGRSVQGREGGSRSYGRSLDDRGNGSGSRSAPPGGGGGGNVAADGDSGGSAAATATAATPSGAGIFYRGTYRDLGAYSSVCDALQACKASMTVILELKEALIAEAAAAVAAGAAAARSSPAAAGATAALRGTLDGGVATTAVASSGALAPPPPRQLQAPPQQQQQLAQTQSELQLQLQQQAAGDERRELQNVVERLQQLVHQLTQQQHQPQQQPQPPQPSPRQQQHDSASQLLAPPPSKPQPPHQEQQRWQHRQQQLQQKQALGMLGPVDLARSGTQPPANSAAAARRCRPSADAYCGEHADGVDPDAAAGPHRSSESTGQADGGRERRVQWQPQPPSAPGSSVHQLGGPVLGRTHGSLQEVQRQQQQQQLGGGPWHVVKQPRAVAEQEPPELAVGGVPSALQLLAQLVSSLTDQQQQQQLPQPSEQHQNTALVVEPPPQSHQRLHPHQRPQLLLQRLGSGSAATESREPSGPAREELRLAKQQQQQEEGEEPPSVELRFAGCPPAAPDVGPLSNVLQLHALLQLRHLNHSGSGGDAGGGLGCRGGPSIYDVMNSSGGGGAAAGGVGALQGLLASCGASVGGSKGLATLTAGAPAIAAMAAPKRAAEACEKAGAHARNPSGSCDSTDGASPTAAATVAAAAATASGRRWPPLPPCEPHEAQGGNSNVSSFDLLAKVPGDGSWEGEGEGAAWDGAAAGTAAADGDGGGSGGSVSLRCRDEQPRLTVLWRGAPAAAPGVSGGGAADAATVAVAAAPNDPLYGQEQVWTGARSRTRPAAQEAHDVRPRDNR